MTKQTETELKSFIAAVYDNGTVSFHKAQARFGIWVLDKMAAKFNKQRPVRCNIMGALGSWSGFDSPEFGIAVYPAGYDGTSAANLEAERACEKQMQANIKFWQETKQHDKALAESIELRLREQVKEYIFNLNRALAA